MARAQGLLANRDPGFAFRWSRRTRRWGCFPSAIPLPAVSLKNICGWPNRSLFPRQRQSKMPGFMSAPRFLVRNSRKVLPISKRCRAPSSVSRVVVLPRPYSSASVFRPPTQANTKPLNDETLLNRWTAIVLDASVNLGKCKRRQNGGKSHQGNTE